MQIKAPSIEEDLAKIEEEEAEYMLSIITGIIKDDKRYKDGKNLVLESYRDYPQSVKNNAKEV